MKKPTAKQIAARKLFAQRAKAGAFKKNPGARSRSKAGATKKPSIATGKAPSARLISRRSKTAKMPKGAFANPVKRTLADIRRAKLREAARYLAAMVESGYTFKQAAAATFKKADITNTVAAKEVERLAREIIRENPDVHIDINSHNAKGGRSVKTNPVKGVARFSVHRPDQSAALGVMFPGTPAGEKAARQYASALADATQKQYALSRVIVAVRV